MPGSPVSTGKLSQCMGTVLWELSPRFGNGRTDSCLGAVIFVGLHLSRFGNGSDALTLHLPSENSHAESSELVRYVARHDGSTNCVPRPGLGPCRGTVASVGELSYFLEVGIVTGILSRGILRISRELARHKLPGNSVPSDRLRPVQGHWCDHGRTSLGTRKHEYAGTRGPTVCSYELGLKLPRAWAQQPLQVMNTDAAPMHHSFLGNVNHQILVNGNHQGGCT